MFTETGAKNEEQSPSEGPKKTDDSNTSRGSKQDSLDKPEVRDSHVRSSSPRRLIKQVALAESPPEEEPHSFYRGVHSDKKHHHHHNNHSASYGMITSLRRISNNTIHKLFYRPGRKQQEEKRKGVRKEEEESRAIFDGIYTKDTSTASSWIMVIVSHKTH